MNLEAVHGLGQHPFNQANSQLHRTALYFLMDLHHFVPAAEKWTCLNVLFHKLASIMLSDGPAACRLPNCSHQGS
jgi:hypothetical protein